MILCAGCKHWQHGICYLILTEDEAPERHICEICGNVITKFNLLKSYNEHRVNEEFGHKTR